MRNPVPGILVLAAVSMLVACSAERPRSNLLLITVDTLRADHLSYHGYHRLTSPAIDSLAGESVMFLNAAAQVPKTAPSLASLLSAQYPDLNSVMNNGHNLKDDVVTLAEVLSENGFYCLAYTANGNLTGERGFAQGFDEFEYLRPSQSAEKLTARVLARLAQPIEERFFVWLHYIDPHAPYAPPAPYDSMFVDDLHYDKNVEVNLDYDPMKGFNKNYILGAVPRYVQRPLAQDPRNQERDYYVARYDGEIRFLDDQLSLLLSFLQRSGLKEDTLIVLTSDHGEGLGEHDYYFEHGWFLYEHQLHVPLIIHSGSRGRVDTPVGLLDLGRTILELLQVPVPESFQGENLMELLKRGRPPNRYVYSQTPRKEYPLFYRALRLGHWKYIVDTNGREELYELSADPGESVNLAAEKPRIMDRFRGELAGGPWLSAGDSKPAVLDIDQMDDETVKELRALGYLD